MGKRPEGTQAQHQTAREVRVLNQYMAPTIYANFANAGMTPWEITLGLNEILKADEKEMLVREIARLAFSPGFAKAVHALLGRTILAYEKEHGLIATRADSEAPAN